MTLKDVLLDQYMLGNHYYIITGQRKRIPFLLIGYLIQRYIFVSRLPLLLSTVIAQFGMIH